MANEDVALLTFELLKRVQGQLNRMEADMGDLKLRVSGIENHLGQQMIQMGALNSRMDRFDERMGRMERRLDLTDA